MFDVGKEQKFEWTIFFDERKVDISESKTVVAHVETGENLYLQMVLFTYQTEYSTFVSTMSFIQNIDFTSIESISKRILDRLKELKTEGDL